MLAALYLGVGVGVWKGASNYGFLPTYDLSNDTAINEHTYTSLIFFVLLTLAEGLIFAYFLDQVREIKKEFSMLEELQKFTFIWIFLTDLTLFLVI